MSLSSVTTDPHPKLYFIRDRSTRTTCIFGLVVSFSIAWICLALAQFVSYKGFWGFRISVTAKYLYPLAINAVITLCTECLGFIHATSLKWALFAEGSLEHNANLRLFTFPRRSWPNGRVCNTLYLFALALCYAATPTIIYEFEDDSDQRDHETCFRAAPVSFFLLGTALFILCVLALWSLCATYSALTWSSNPICVGAAVTILDPNLREEGRCMRSAYDLQDSAPTKPKLRQKSACSTHPQARFILGIEYVVLFVLLISITLVGQFCKTKGRNWSIIPDDCFISKYKPGDEKECTTAYVMLHFLGHFPETEWVPDAYIWVQVLFTALVQSILTIGLHCAELLVTLSRDEAAWRMVSSPKGSSTSHTSAIFALLNWQSLTLSVLKPFLYWVHGMAFSINERGLAIFHTQLIYLTIFWALFLIFITFVSFQKPHGPLPAAYGHLKTLANLADEWHEKMFWGHKSEGDDGICHAGTSNAPLEEIRMNSLYKGKTL